MDILFVCLFYKLNHVDYISNFMGNDSVKAHLQFVCMSFFSLIEKLQDIVIFLENRSVPNG